jgi:tetratricopeptide (TPR) repeat protein
MSLINQMLKDLEKRARNCISDEAILSGLYSTASIQHKNNIKKYWLIAGLVFIGLICFFIVIHKKILYSHVQPKIIYRPNALVQSFVPAARTLHNTFIPTLHMTPAILTGITLQLQKETTFLRLLMSQNALYRISQNLKKQLIIVIENARLVTSLPPIDTLNSAIKTIQMINRSNGDLEIILLLQSGAELTHLELNETGKLPELQIDLSYNELAHSVTTKHDLQNEVTEEKIDSIIKLRTDISLADQYQEALHYSTQGRTHEAVILLTKLLVKEPAFSPARESLASLLLAQGNVIKAQQIIAAGLQQRPFYPPYIQLKAKMLVDKGKINQALNLLQIAAPPLKADPGYHGFIAALYQRQGQPVLAEQLYEQLLALQPNNATWWIGLAIALESMDKHTLAIEAYLKAKSSDNLSPELKAYAEVRVRKLQSS